VNRTTRLFFRQSGIARTRSGWQNAQLWAGHCIVKNELTVFDARLYIRVRRLDEAPQRSAAFVATAMACWRITRACFKNIFHFSLRRSKTRSSTPPRAKPKPRVSGPQELRARLRQSGRKMSLLYLRGLKSARHDSCTPPRAKVKTCACRGPRSAAIAHLRSLRLNAKVVP